MSLCFQQSSVCIYPGAFLLQDTPLVPAAPALGGAGFAQGKPGSGGGRRARAECCVLGQDGPREGAARSGHSEGTFRGQGAGGHRARILADALPLALLLGAGRGLLTERVQVSDPEDRRDRSARLTGTGLTPSSMEALVKPALGRGAGQAMVSPCVPPLSSQLHLLFRC